MDKGGILFFLLLSLEFVIYYMIQYQVNIQN